MSPSRARPSSPPAAAPMSASTSSSWRRARRRSPSSPRTRRNRPRRDQPTASRVVRPAASTLPGDPPVRPRRAPARARVPHQGEELLLAQPRPAGPGPPRTATSPPRTAASQVIDSNGPPAAVTADGHATDRKSRTRSTAAVAAVTSCARRRPSCRRQRPRLVQLLRDVAVQLRRQPRDQHRIRLVPLMPGVVLLLPGDMRHQRLHAHQRQPPLPAQPLDLHPPRPGRLARHRHPRRTPAPRRRHGRVRDHRARAGAPRTARRPAATAPACHDRPAPAPASPRPGRSPAPPRHAAPAPAAAPGARSAAGPNAKYRYPCSSGRPPWMRLGHQARTTAPGGRPLHKQNPAKSAASRATSYYYGRGVTLTPQVRALSAVAA